MTFELAEMESQLSMAMWGNGTKINCVGLQLTQSIRCNWQRPRVACDQWSMLYFVGSFSNEPFNNPGSLWECISHTTAGAVNICLIKLEMHLWFVISLIEAAYGHFSKNPVWLQVSWQEISACCSQQRSTLNNFNQDDLFLLMCLKESCHLIIYKGEKSQKLRSRIINQPKKS